MNKKNIIWICAIIAIIIIAVVAFSKNSSENNTNTNNTTEKTSEDSSENKTEETTQDDSSKLLQYSEIKTGDELAVIKTNLGDIKIRLFREQAPKTVENFVTHAKNGYYDGVIFHRVIKDFMIQSGDPDGTGMGGESIWGEDFENEISDKLFHFNGALSMANTGQPKSNGSQFFIVQNNKIDDMTMEQVNQAFPENVAKKYAEVGGTPHLDGRHTVFGQVYDTMDIVNKIADAKTDENDKPIEDIVIESIKILEQE